MKFGLLGRTLGHSFSPRIHNALGNTNYELFEREPSQLQESSQTQNYKVLILPSLTRLMPLKPAM